jgi:hypothetical protein
MEKPLILSLPREKVKWFGTHTNRKRKPTPPSIKKKAYGKGIPFAAGLK